MEEPTLALATLVALGVGAQWLAAKAGVPAILVLLVTGLAAGPGLDLVDPDALLGDLLLPAVSLGVGLLLFEGGLGLHLSELGSWRGVLLRLLTVGVAVSATGATLAAVVLGGIPLDAAIVFGSIMTVTGPTVIIPLLRQTRLRPRVGRVLRWEGIFVDAIGATLGIVAVEAVVAEGGAGEAAGLVALTALSGLLVGAGAALLLAGALARRLVPDHIEISVILAAVLGAFAVADHLRSESGLLAATVMGVVMANQRRAPVRHVIAFQESLGTLLIGGIFLVLGARVDAAALRGSLLPGVGVVLVLVVLVRPLAVTASTLGSSLTRNERLFLAGMAPRGIVAASVSEVLALRLAEAGIPAGEDLAALTFVVVGGTVIVYGLAAGRLASRLRVGMPEPAGVVFVGAPPWAIEVATLLASAEVAVLIITTDRHEVRMARHADLLVYEGDLGDRDLTEAVAALGVKHVIAVSHREELNAFATERLGHIVGRANVYELPRQGQRVDGTNLQPFGAGLDHDALTAILAEGGQVRARPGASPGGLHPLLAVTDGRVEVLTGEPAGSPDLVVGLQSGAETP